MRRPWSQRFLAVLVTSWFALLGLEPAAFHACPTHGAAGGAHASHALHAASMDAAAHSAMAEHPASSGASHDHDAPADGHGHQCTCPGSCVGPSALTLASAQLSLGVRTLRVASVVATSPVFRPEWNDRLLPFATAPPVRV